MNEAKSEAPVNMSSILSPSVAQYLHPDYLQPLPTTVGESLSLQLLFYNISVHGFRLNFGNIAQNSSVSPRNSCWVLIRKPLLQ